jgi:hypothetical protein
MNFTHLRNDSRMHHKLLLARRSQPHVAKEATMHDFNCVAAAVSAAKNSGRRGQFTRRGGRMERMG